MIKNLNIRCKKKARKLENDYFKLKLLYKMRNVENKLHLRIITKK